MATGGWWPRLADAVVGLPLFYKVLVANCLVVLVGVVLGTWFTLHFVDGANGQVHWGFVALMLVVGFTGSVVINGAVLAMALQPLHSLERAVDRVAGGDLQARVQPVFFRDPDVERLADTVNTMLDVLQEHRGQVKQLSSVILAAQEDERKRIARELHDETAQALTTLLIRLRMLEKARDADELHAQIQELRDLTHGTLEGVRKLAVELRPTTLDNLGLVAALEAYTETYGSRLPLHVTFAADGFEGSDRLSPEVELVLYRVVQEALTNTAKHADARSVSVRLARTQAAVTATVIDDGTGFNVEEVMRSRERGLGLFGMQERLALVEGEFTIDSKPRAGTRVMACVPIVTGTGLEGSAIAQRLH